MISQEEYLDAVVKATTARKTFSYTDNESISEQELIANGLRAKQSLKVSTYVTKAEAYSILSKELGIAIEPNAEESGDNLTRGEALNLIVNTLINNSEIAEEFNEVPASEAEHAEEQASNEDTPTYSEPAQTYNESSQSQGSSSGSTYSEEEKQAMLDKLANLPGYIGSSDDRDKYYKDKGTWQENEHYIPGMENIRLH